MNYFDVKAKVDVILSKKKILMTVLTMLVILIIYGTRFLNIWLSTGNTLSDNAISLLLSFFGVLFSNLVYFCILQHARGTAFGTDTLRFSMSHIGVQAGLGVVYILLRYAIDTLLGVFGILMPFLYLPLNLCLMLLYLAAESVLAYCIYDGGINILEMVRGCFQFVKAKAGILIRSGFAYLISYFAYVISLVSVISGSLQVSDGMLDVERTIAFIASDPLSGTVLSILGLTVLFWVIFAYFELRIFTSAAVLYEENAPIYFSRMKVKNTR